jgi:hypothetical protein
MGQLGKLLRLGNLPHISNQELRPGKHSARKTPSLYPAHTCMVLNHAMRSHDSNVSGPRKVIIECMVNSLEFNRPLGN